MKTLLIGLLTLGTLSAHAIECTDDVKPFKTCANKVIVDESSFILEGPIVDFERVIKVVGNVWNPDSGRINGNGPWYLPVSGLESSAAIYKKSNHNASTLCSAFGGTGEILEVESGRTNLKAFISKSGHEYGFVDSIFPLKGITKLSCKLF
jgi:hypothetical protein